MLRKSLALLCMLCVLAAVPMGAGTFAVTAAEEHICGDYAYTIVFNGRGAELTRYVGNGENIVIPARVDGLPVRGIDLTFPCASPTRLTIPMGVEYIQKLAFTKDRLTELSLPMGLKVIGHRALGQLTHLESLTVPCTVALIGGIAPVKEPIPTSLPQGVLLRGEAGSRVESWAKAYGYDFEAIDSVPSPGDVDGDRAITATDARLVLQYYAQKIGEDALDVSLADVDGSGTVDATDARLLLQHFAKVDTLSAVTVPCGRLCTDLIDPKEVVSVTHITYKARSYEKLTSEPVEDPQKEIDLINRWAKSASMDYWVKDYPKGSTKVLLRNGCVISYNNYNELIFIEHYR